MVPGTVKFLLTREPEVVFAEGFANLVFMVFGVEGVFHEMLIVLKVVGKET